MDRRKVGKQGEDFAASYLVSRKYRIIHRNWTCRGGELDLIALDPKKKLVFVEVKYIRESNYCEPHELLTQRKKNNLFRSIQIYLNNNENKDINNWQLDLIGLKKKKHEITTNHYKDVFSF